MVPTTVPGWDGRVSEHVPARGPLATAWLLRLALTLTALSAVAQPVLIGGYLDGGFDLLAWHAGNANLMLALVMLTGATALLYVWPGGGRPWPVLALGALWFAAGVQIGMGYLRVLAVHVPLGVTVVAAAVGLAVWSWTPSARRRRVGWW